MKITIIRHGRTRGNIERRYSGGRTDDPLAPEGIEGLRIIHSRMAESISSILDDPDANQAGYITEVYVSPMTRARETAAILLPDAEQIIVEELREMDFGRFEGKNYEELDGDSLYQAWIDSGCRDPIPEGESIEEFARRIMQGLGIVVKSAISGRKINSNNCSEDAGGSDRASDHVYIVAHGGTIMAMMSTLTGEEYFKFNPDNGCGYTIDLEVDDAGNIISAGAYDSFCGWIHS